MGKSIASRLAKEGCNIAICDINIKEAQITSDEIKRKFKVSCEAFKVDVSDTEHVNRLQNEIEGKMGTVDILVGIFFQKYKVVKFLEFFIHSS